MIIDLKARDSIFQTEGQFEVKSIGIDTSNINKAIFMLTHKLYSNPLESFLREIVSNGWDSHVVADKKDEPVVITIEPNTDGSIDIDREPTKLFQDSKSFNISIRDYGTGMTPEDFDQYYMSLLATTKDTSDELIGGYGIGRFTAITVSSNALINNYYNGKLYSFLLAKEGVEIKILKLAETDTDEVNGMQVTVLNVETALQKIFHGIHKLRFFPNLVINVSEDYDIFIKRFNNRKIVDLGNGMKRCSLTGKESKFKYSLIRNHIEYLVDDNSDSSTISYCARMNYISFEVDHRIVSVTPNREELQFVSSTLESLFAENEVKYAEYLHKHIEKLAEATVNLIKDSGETEFLSVKNFVAFQKTKAQSNTLSDGTCVTDSLKATFNSLLDSFYFDSDYSTSEMLNDITDWIIKFNDRRTNNDIRSFYSLNSSSIYNFNLTEAVVSESQVKVQEGGKNSLSSTLNLFLDVTRSYSNYTILLNDFIDSQNVELKRKLRDYVRYSDDKRINFICINSKELLKVKLALRETLREYCGDSKAAVQIFDSMLNQLWKEIADILMSGDRLMMSLSDILGNSSIKPIQGQKIHYDIGDGRWETKPIENFARRSGPIYYVDAKEVDANATTDLRPKFLQMKTLFQVYKNVFGIPDRQQITFIIFKSAKNQKDITTGEFGHKFKPISEFFNQHKITLNILNTVITKYSNTSKFDVVYYSDFVRKHFPYLDWNVFIWYSKQLHKRDTLANDKKQQSNVLGTFKFIKKLGFEFKEDPRIVNVENLMESFESAYQTDQKILMGIPGSTTLRVLMDVLKTLPIRITSYRYKGLKEADEKSIENLIKCLT